MVENNSKGMTHEERMRMPHEERAIQFFSNQPS